MALWNLKPLKNHANCPAAGNTKIESYLNDVWRSGCLIQHFLLRQWLSPLNCLWKLPGGFKKTGRQISPPGSGGLSAEDPSRRPGCSARAGATAPPDSLTADAAEGQLVLPRVFQGWQVLVVREGFCVLFCLRSYTFLMCIRKLT